MKTFKNVCAQGDIYITRTDMTVPEGAVEIQPEGNHVIVTHSESGHNHVMEKDKARLYQLPDNIMKCLLIVDDPVALEHLRTYDTHESIWFEKGSYLIHRQREYTPEGFRKVED